MTKRFYMFVAIVIISAFCCRIYATERFVVIADAEVPELMKTVQSVSAFSEPIIPGSSMIILGGVIALNFSPQFAPFDMTSGLRFMAYGDTAEQKTLPVLCGMAKYKSKQPLPKTIKISKNKFFVKSLDGKAVVSSSNQLLDELKTIEKTEKTDSDVVINIFPEKYLQQCSGNIDHLRGKFDNEVAGGDVKKYIPDNQVLEKLLSQCKKMQIKVKTHKKNIDLNMQVHPVSGSELAAFLKANKAGDLSTDALTNLAKKVTDSDSLNVTDGLNGVLTLILIKIFPNGNSEVFSKLCNIKVSNDKSCIQFNTSISQEALKQTLIAAGVIKPPRQKHGS
jgi:hypothetical protein